MPTNSLWRNLCSEIILDNNEHISAHQAVIEAEITRQQREAYNRAMEEHRRVLQEQLNNTILYGSALSFDYTYKTKVKAKKREMSIPWL